MSRVRFEVAGSWNGGPLAPNEFARIELRADRFLELGIDASYHGDPPPSAPPGTTPGLWEFEVVELFLLGEDERYLEIELGPHGHHLVLRLEGRRRVVESGLPIDFRARRSESHWHGHARVSRDWLPAGLHAANAYAIHGQGANRRYLAAHPVPGPEPDFHRLEHFAPLDLEQAPRASRKRTPSGI
ncbi:MAG: hypothetical protein JRG86_12415 [Deltaproteobacteria bacterium]|nr:hypothetical protein [Deltaproteobacteria bacterium]